MKFISLYIRKTTNIVRFFRTEDEACSAKKIELLIRILRKKRIYPEVFRLFLNQPGTNLIVKRVFYLSQEVELDNWPTADYVLISHLEIEGGVICRGSKIFLLWLK